jgi:hypothetical protein
MEADLVDGTTKTAYLKMTLNGKSWSNWDRVITVSETI